LRVHPAGSIYGDQRLRDGIFGTCVHVVVHRGSGRGRGYCNLLILLVAGCTRMGESCVSRMFEWDVEGE